MSREELNQQYTDLCAQLGHAVTQVDRLKMQIATVQEQATALAKQEQLVAQAVAEQKAKDEKLKIAEAAKEIVEENAPLLDKLAKV